MMYSIMEWLTHTVAKLGIEEFSAKDVIEVGSRYVNGSARHVFEVIGVRKYIGVDIFEGDGVDMVHDGKRIPAIFGKNSFDVVVCTETLEHVADWKALVVSMKSVLKNNGLIFLTTCMKGFPAHNYPWDYWRFDGRGMKEIFSDFEIVSLNEDSAHLSVMVCTRKMDDSNVYRLIPNVAFPVLSQKLTFKKRLCFILSKQTRKFARRIFR